MTWRFAFFEAKLFVISFKTEEIKVYHFRRSLRPGEKKKSSLFFIPVIKLFLYALKNDCSLLFVLFCL